ncbi:MAG TPA: fibronectin type III domain-containing protein [Candidatus Moranbacteria bacterium]|nr:fibronectin type III domain-containing protein [Candidatus Moranbacteria bacterium]
MPDTKKKKIKKTRPKKKGERDFLAEEKIVYPENNLAEDKILFFSSETETKNPRFGKNMKVMRISFVFLLAVMVLSGISSFLEKRGNENKDEKKISIVPVSDDKIVGVVRGEENNVASINVGAVQMSENFEARQVSVGGDILALAEEEMAPLEIGDIKSESFIPPKEEKGKVRLVVSWKTNKMAVGDIEYSKNNGQDVETVKEESFNFDHNIIINNLEPKTSYVYKVKCRDKWGNENQSGHFGVYTVSEKVSVFDMLSDALDKTFGWAFD